MAWNGRLLLGEWSKDAGASVELQLTSGENIIVKGLISMHPIVYFIFSASSSFGCPI